MDNSKRVTLITGAAGGIGGAVAQRFIDDGHTVVITDIVEDKLEAVGAEVGAKAIVADCTKRESVDSLIGAIVAEHGGLDTVIAAQGTSSPGTLSPKSEDAWFQALDTSLNASYLLASASIRHLVERQGSIVMFTSTAGVFSAGPGGVGYTAAKAGVIGLMRWIARDFGPKGVRANAVAPGWTETPLSGFTINYLAEREGISVEEARKLAVAHVPNRRFGQPSEIASVCAFLASEDASMVNGHVLVADGGAAIVDTTTVALDVPEA